MTPWTVCSPPDSSVHGTLQARILEWVAISFHRRSSRPRDQTLVSFTASRFFTVWTTREAPNLNNFNQVWVQLNMNSDVWLEITLGCWSLRAFSNMQAGFWDHLFISRIPYTLNDLCTVFPSKWSFRVSCSDCCRLIMKPLMGGQIKWLMHILHTVMVPMD